MSMLNVNKSKTDYLVPLNCLTTRLSRLRLDYFVFVKLVLIILFLNLLLSVDWFTGDVYIHPTANVHSSAVIGPNVSVSQGVTVGRGVRLCESIILGNTVIGDHSLVKNSIIGWNSAIGSWARVCTVYNKLFR